MAKIPSKKNVNLFYFRADWGSKKSKNKLSKLIKTAFEAFDTSGKRTFKFSDGREIRCSKFQEKNDDMYLHITTCVPGQPTSTVENKIDVSELKVEPYEAPSGKDFLDGDLFIFVRQNHVVLCSSGARINTAELYIRKILNKNHVDTSNFSLEKIVKNSAANLIQKEGVKSVLLNSSLYEASLIELNEDRFESIKKSIADQFEVFFSRDETLKEIRENENLNVRLLISFDGKEARLKSHKDDEEFGAIGKKRLLEFSQNLLDESDDDDGFIIVTNSGKKITPNSISISEKVRIETLGKSLSRISAFLKIEEYAEELQSKGVFEQ